jgi:hypothetical protein
MTKLGEFKKRYEKEARKLLAKMPELDKKEVLRPFWESRFLPAGSECLLMLAEAIPKKSGKIFGVLARAALGSFLLERLAAIGSHAEKLPLKRRASKDPVLDLFLSEGLSIAAELSGGICIKNLSGLAIFVSCLDYAAVFADPANALAVLKREAVENGLVKAGKRGRRKNEA